MNLNLSRILCVSSCSAATHISLNFVDWRLEMVKRHWAEIKVIIMIDNQTFYFAWLNLWSTLLEHFILIDRQQRFSTCWYSLTPQSKIVPKVDKRQFFTQVMVYCLIPTNCSRTPGWEPLIHLILWIFEEPHLTWKINYSRNKMFQMS